MNTGHPATWSDDELLTRCKLTFSRASGPGGQNRNKVETSVQIEFIPTGTLAQASELRTQNENRKVAIQRLRCKLAIEEFDLGHLSNENSDETTEPSELWTRYSRDSRINISETNPEWPSLLAELVCKLRYLEWDVGATATELNTSSSQLVKVLKKFPPALAKLNAERVARNQRPLS